ncbi:hypothetical protein FBU59_005648, partial [Linderina macrospora]
MSQPAVPEMPAPSTPAVGIETVPPPVFVEETECVEEESTPASTVMPPVTVTATITVTQPAVTITATVSEVCVTIPAANMPQPPFNFPPYATQWGPVVWEVPLYPYGPGPVIF